MNRLMTLKELREYAMKEFVVVKNRNVISRVNVEELGPNHLYLKRNGARYGLPAFRDHLNNRYEGTLTLKELRDEIYNDLRVMFLTVETIFELAE